MVNMITALCGYFSGTFVCDTGGTFKSDTPGTFVSDIGGTFEVILSTQLHYFSNQVCYAYKCSILKREKGNFADRAEKGQIIYSSIAGVGYCYVISTTKQNEYCLARRGFDWNPNENEYINHFGDSDYRPLPLKRMTVIEL